MGSGSDSVRVGLDVGVHSAPLGVSAGGDRVVLGLFLVVGWTVGSQGAGEGGPAQARWLLLGCLCLCVGGADGGGVETFEMSGRGVGEGAGQGSVGGSQGWVVVTLWGGDDGRRGWRWWLGWGLVLLVSLSWSVVLFLAVIVLVWVWVWVWAWVWAWVWVWAGSDLRKPAMEHRFHLQDHTDVALTHVWVLEDSHYSLDPVHSNALLETAKTF